METKSSDILLSLNHHNLEVWKVGDDIVCVKYVDSYIRDPPCLIGAFGRGGTFEGACHDYLSQIRGKTLVFDAYDDKKRKEITVLG